MDPYAGKKILIAGLGKSGKAAALYLLEKKALLFCFEDKEIDSEAREFFEKGMKKIPLEEALRADFDFMVASPGFPVKHPLYEGCMRRNIPILGEMELAFKVLDKKAVGVTGTNGKTTVVTQIAEALRDNGIRAEPVGNIGTPLIESILCKNPLDAYVIEISSFQLETLKTPKLLSGCILNITPDHLDRYSSMEEYALTKGKMSDVVDPKGWLYVEEKTFTTWQKGISHPHVARFGFSPDCDVALIRGVIRRFGKEECQVPKNLLQCPSHDLENLLAAYALLRDLDLEQEQIIHSFEKFKKPPHRIEFVRSLRGVSFYDDSKGTNVDAVIKAAASLKGKVLLIAGGVDKGASYKLWIPHFEGKVEKIFAIGQAKEKIHEELSSLFHVEICQNLQEAVETAFQAAGPNDNILLSPGCSSFDMFRDYKQRGEEFKKIVLTL